MELYTGILLSLFYIDVTNPMYLNISLRETGSDLTHSKKILKKDCGQTMFKLQSSSCLAGTLAQTVH